MLLFTRAFNRKLTINQTTRTMKAHVLVIVRDGIVSEIYSDQKGVKVTVLDVDDQSSDPVVVIEDNKVGQPPKSIQSIIDDEFNKHYG